MPATTVNISFRPELLREAARVYVERQRRWNSVFDLGDATTRKHNLTEADVREEISAFRKSRDKQ